MAQCLFNRILKDSLVWSLPMFVLFYLCFSCSISENFYLAGIQSKILYEFFYYNRNNVSCKQKLKEYSITSFRNFQLDKKLD